MSIILHNNTHLVIPGMQEIMSGATRVDLAYFETPYGLVIPMTSCSHQLIRFLRHYKKDDRDTWAMAPAWNRRLIALLFTNRGELEFFRLDSTPIVKGQQLEVYSLPAVGEDWKVEDPVEGIKALAITEIISKMKVMDAVDWIEEHSGERIQHPIVVDKAKWVEVRKALRNNYLQGQYWISDAYQEK